MVQETELTVNELNQPSGNAPPYSTSESSSDRTDNAGRVEEQVVDEWKLDENDDSMDERREIRSLVDDLDDDDVQNDTSNGNNSNFDIDVTKNLAGQMNGSNTNVDDDITSSKTNASIVTTQDQPTINDQDALPNPSGNLLSEGTTSSQYLDVENASMDVPLTNPLRLVPTAAPFLLQQSLKPPQGWDQLVRSGTRIKTLFSDAIGEVKNSIIAVQNHNMKRRTRSNDDDDNNNIGESPSKQSRVVAVADFTVELAREKTAQVMQLQRVSSTTIDA
jgi:hypothetical protein